MPRNARSIVASIAARLRALLSGGANLSEARMEPAARAMNPYLTQTLPPDIAELSRKYADRCVQLFLLDQKLIERQNHLIAKTVHSFFLNTHTYRAVDVDTIAKHIREFRSVFLESPVMMNDGGANFPSGVNLFLLARCLGPGLVVESGVYKGQSSYILASACPQAVVHAFDISMQALTHRAQRVNYHECDWMSMDVRCGAGETGLCFFDDHQNQAQRIIQAHERGFRHVIVDDSWPIEAVTGCGWPPLPSVDMVMNNPLAPDEEVKWVEMGRIWTFVNTDAVRDLCARARRLIKSAYEVPSLYRESGIAPTSAYKFVELI